MQTLKKSYISNIATSIDTALLQIIVMFFCLLLPITVSAEIYTWKDEKGKIHFSDSKPFDPANEKSDPKKVDISTVNSVKKERKEISGKKYIMPTPEKKSLTAPTKPAPSKDNFTERRDGSRAWSLENCKQVKKLITLPPLEEGGEMREKRQWFNVCKDKVPPEYWEFLPEYRHEPKYFTEDNDE